MFLVALSCFWLVTELPGHFPPAAVAPQGLEEEVSEKAELKVGDVLFRSLDFLIWSHDLTNSGDDCRVFKRQFHSPSLFEIFKSKLFDFTFSDQEAAFMSGAVGFRGVPAADS